MVAVIRLQQRLKPYKLEDNNWIEFVGLVAGTVTIYTGFVFTARSDTSVQWLYNGALVLTFAVNVYFMVNWTYLLLESIESQNKYFKMVIQIYATILCKSKMKNTVKDPQNNKKEAIDIVDCK